MSPLRSVQDEEEHIVRKKQDVQDEETSYDSDEKNQKRRVAHMGNHIFDRHLKFGWGPRAEVEPMNEDVEPMNARMIVKKYTLSLSQN